MMCNFDDKLSQLLSFIAKKQNQKFIVYFLTCACVDFFWKVIISLTSYLFLFHYSFLYSIIFFVLSVP